MKPGPIQQEWINILKTTDKLQGIGKLHTFDRRGYDAYCCLGILAECVLLPRGLVDREKANGMRRSYRTTARKRAPWSNISLLEMYTHAKLISEEGEVSKEELANLYSEEFDKLLEITNKRFRPNRARTSYNFRLSSLNDSGIGFETIGRLLEKFPQLYFTESV